MDEPIDFSKIPDLNSITEEQLQKYQLAISLVISKNLDLGFTTGLKGVDIETQSLPALARQCGKSSITRALFEETMKQLENNELAMAQNDASRFKCAQYSSVEVWANGRQHTFTNVSNGEFRIPNVGNVNVTMRITNADTDLFIDGAVQLAKHSQRFIAAPGYKPKKGKQDKFSRLQAIHHGINSKRKK
jgi:hypothetical protein